MATRTPYQPVRSHVPGMSLPRVSRGNRLSKSGQVLTGLALAAITLVSLHEAVDHDKSTPVAAASVCVPSTETTPFTFVAGQGKNNAVLAIVGSGNGSGDPCWDTADEIVKSQLIDQDPYGNPSVQYGETIEIPVSIHLEPSVRQHH